MNGAATRPTMIAITPSITMSALKSPIRKLEFTTSSSPTRADGPALLRMFRSKPARSSRSRRSSSRAAPNRRGQFHEKRTRCRSKIDPEQQARLLSFKIDQIKRTRNGSCMTGNLRTPREGHPCALGKFEIDRGTGKEALSDEIIE